MRAEIVKFFSENKSRNFQINRNISMTLVLKGGSVLVAFLTVPMTINYINPVQYGIWLTLSSMIYWINAFDIGIGNGLKNEIAYSRAIGDETNLRKYVSTSYAILSMIGAFIFLAFLILSLFVNWNNLLNVSSQSGLDISPVVTLFVGFFCVQFVLQLLDAVTSATQQVFYSSLILFVGQLLGFVLIYVSTLLMPGSLFLLVMVVSGSSVLVLIAGSFYLYNTRYIGFSPSIKDIDFSGISKLLKFSGVFFVIQIGAMIIIYSNNFIISRIMGPQSVTLYNIPFRLFSFIPLLFSIVIGPYWSAFTESYAVNDIDWIKKSIKKLRSIWLMLFLLGLLIFSVRDFLFKIWIGDVILIPTVLSICIFINIMCYAWHTIHVCFLNGIGKIRLQLYVIVIGAAFNVYLSFLLGRLFFLPGIIIANAITFSIMGLIFTIQYSKIISGKASGIWIK